MLRTNTTIMPDGFLFSLLEFDSDKKKGKW